MTTARKSRCIRAHARAQPFCNNYLWRVLDHLGFPTELGIVIRALYTGFSSTLMIPGATQVVLRSSRGVRQGCPLSPALFALFAEPLGALIDNLGAGGSSSPPPPWVGSSRLWPTVRLFA